MASGTEVLIKQKNVTEFLHAETVAPIDISVNIFECLWRSKNACEQSGAFQQWQQRVTSAGADFYEHSIKAFAYHQQKCVASGGDC